MVAGQQRILPDWEDASAMPTAAIDNSRPQSTLHDLDLDRIPSKIAFNSVISGLFSVSLFSYNYYSASKIVRTARSR